MGGTKPVEPAPTLMHTNRLRPPVSAAEVTERTAHDIAAALGEELDRAEEIARPAPAAKSDTPKR